MDLAYSMILSTIDDLFLVNYIGKRCDRTQLFGSNEVENLKRRMNHVFYEPRSDDAIVAFPIMQNYREASFDIGYTLRNNQIVYNFLHLANGKVSLCGDAVFDIMYGRLVYCYDLFFHSCTKEEADNLLNKYLSIIEDYEFIKFQISQNYFSICINEKETRIHREIFQTKDQILMSFDLAPLRNGWNPIDKYFTTICGAFSCAMKLCPIDTTRWISVENLCISRIMGYTILFPELPSIQREESLKFHNITISNSNDKLSLHVDPIEYGDDNCIFLITDQEQNIKITVPIEELFNVSPKTIRDNIATPKWILSHDLPNVSLLETKIFMGEDFNKYLISLTTDVNESISIWNNKLNMCVDRAIKSLSSIEKWKKHRNTFSSMTEPNTFYGPRHIRTQTGLKHDRFVEFYKCGIMYNIPKDLFNILCQYWLEAEYFDSYMRLIQYTIPKNHINVVTFDTDQKLYINECNFII